MQTRAGKHIRRVVETLVGLHILKSLTHAQYPSIQALTGEGAAAWRVGRAYEGFCSDGSITGSIHGHSDGNTPVKTRNTSERSSCNMTATGLCN